MWIPRFRTLMETATRTAGEELSGLSGHIQTVLRTLVSDLIDLGTDWGREMTLVASISASKRPSGSFPEPKVTRATCAAARRPPRGPTY